MQLGTSSDAELVRLAQRGASPPFAVLVHRHAPAVRARVADDRDPTGAVVATFVTAMRRLPKRSPDDPVRPWLLDLADRQVRRPAPLPEDPSDLPPLDPDEADEIWAELELRWPRGRVRRSMPRWVAPVALVIVMVALAVLVPYLLLTVGTDGPEAAPIEDVVARPYEEEPAADRAPAEELFEGNVPDDGDLDATDDGDADTPGDGDLDPTDDGAFPTDDGDLDATDDGDADTPGEGDLDPAGDDVGATGDAGELDEETP
jgi:hypothetical protein